MRRHPPSLDREHNSILKLLHGENKTPHYLLADRLTRHIFRLNHFRNEFFTTQLLEALKPVAGEFDPYVRCCQLILDMIHDAKPEGAPVSAAAYSP